MSVESPTGPKLPAPATGVKRIGLAFRYSCSGLRVSFMTGAAFRQECVLAVVLITTALLLPLDPISKAFLIAPVFLVLITELLNTAIEAVVDLASPGYHQLAKQAKDAGSAAVFLSFINLGVIWALVLFEPIRNWLPGA
ncbi:MAG: diacylglycerol kinase [Opitutales bacterium]